MSPLGSVERPCLPSLVVIHQGISLGVADGVGGWTDTGIDPSLFSQSLMYHAHRYAKQGWAGEPEIDPTQDYEERQQVEGWELLPMECMHLAHGAVLREKVVTAGPFDHFALWSIPLTEVLGSSTACIVNINASSGLLRAAKYVVKPMISLTYCPDHFAIEPVLETADSASYAPLRSFTPSSRKRISSTAQSTFSDTDTLKSATCAYIQSQTISQNPAECATSKEILRRCSGGRR